VADIKRYGEGELDGDYYLVRESSGSIGGLDRVVSFYIDGLGRTSRVAVGKLGALTPEQIAERRFP
jgi:hypothetical protein